MLYCEAEVAAVAALPFCLPGYPAYQLVLPQAL